MEWYRKAVHTRDRGSGALEWAQGWAGPPGGLCCRARRKVRKHEQMPARWEVLWWENVKKFSFLSFLGYCCYVKAFFVIQIWGQQLHIHSFVYCLPLPAVRVLWLFCGLQIDTLERGRWWRRSQFILPSSLSKYFLNAEHSVGFADTTGNKVSALMTLIF